MIEHMLNSDTEKTSGPEKRERAGKAAGRRGCQEQLLLRPCVKNDKKSGIFVCSPDLHNGLLSMNLQHLPRSLLTVLERQIDDLSVFGQLHVVENHERTLHSGHSGVVWREPNAHTEEQRSTTSTQHSGREGGR